MRQKSVIWWLSMLFTISLNAQTWKVYKNDGSVSRFPASKVDSVIVVATTESDSTSTDPSQGKDSVIVEPTTKDEQKALTKYVHFSLDDCTFWTDLIDNEATYTSCFENAKLAKLKQFHEEFGIVVTLNCFIVSGDYSISDVPSKFAAEFAANKDWLRFSFHGTTTTETFGGTDAIVLKGYYDTFVEAIFKMTGTYDCIDRVVRLSSYTGNLENILALRDTNCGITGLLCSDNDVNKDVRHSYYLTEAQDNYLHHHDKLYDVEHNLWFFRTVRRLENSSIPPTALNTPLYANFRPFLEIFFHETTGWQSNYSYNNTLKPWFSWLNENGYQHAFTADIMHIN
ncbi:MAG: hypothetical protein IJ762_10875 [Bacteroidaceae bacterium]|nr:hypothetical protein [Bacteroidaceae bacterium]